MSWYRSRVERDLARWQQAGWVNEAGASAIRTDLQSRKSAFGIAPVFAILGAVLFGFAVMSFVAAHWTAMSKLARLGLLLATLWGCYGGAGLPVPAPAQRLRACRRARRHCRLRRLDHADRADVPHGGQSARRGAHVGARRPARRRAGALQPGAGRDVRAPGGVDLLGARAQPRPRIGHFSPPGPPPPPRPPGSDGARACIWPR